MLLPRNRDDYEFSLGGEARVDNRASVTIDFRSVSKETPEVVWTDDCVRVTVPGMTRGRIWIDAVTHEVLRMDEHLARFSISAHRRRSRGAPARRTCRSSVTIRRSAIAP